MDPGMDPGCNGKSLVSPDGIAHPYRLTKTKVDMAICGKGQKDGRYTPSERKEMGKWRTNASHDGRYSEFRIFGI